MLYENPFVEGPYITYWNYKNTYPMHLHEKVEVLYFLEGTGVAIVGNKRYEYQKGDLLLILPYELHAYEDPSPDQLNIAMGIPISMLSGYGLNLFAIRPESHLIRLPEKQKRFGHLVDVLETYRNHYWEEVNAIHISCAFFGEVVKEVNFVPRFKNDMKASEKLIIACNENYLDPTFTVSSLSEKTGISERSISRFFSESLDTSFPKFISMMRVARAIDLIEHEGYNITKAALESGFGSVRSFNRSFKAEKNFTPRQYFVKKEN
ncbi:MAG: helix-turn-helix transcriptional regulator [Clostridia bacterium]|nr:helix-turn-helix transcriptional regulator [Clostridia bacterium]